MKHSACVRSCSDGGSCGGIVILSVFNVNFMLLFDIFCSYGVQPVLQALNITNIYMMDSIWYADY